MSNQPNHDDLTEQERAALEAAKFGITSASSRETANDLAAMAYDPNIQREMRAIAYEFKDTEMDGLTDDPQPEDGGKPAFDFEPQNIREVALCNAAGNIISALEEQVATLQRELREAQAGAAAMRKYLSMLVDRAETAMREAGVNRKSDLSREIEAVLSHTAGAELLAELEYLRTALEQIQTLTLELTVQSRLSATEPGSKISNICLHALGLITDEEFEAAKGE